jgi:hypothetical protein
LASILDKNEARASRLGRWRRAGYILIAFLIVVVFVLSIVQIWFMYTATDVPGFGSIRADERGLPPADQRGAFLLLNEGINPNYPGTVVQLLATTQPGVIDQASGAHLGPGDIDAVYVQSAAVSEGADYRVYQIGDVVQSEMKVERQQGGKAISIRPSNSTWKPGAYIVDIPSDGMFGGRTYFQFYVDDPKP